MGQVVRFISRSDIERARLIREARAIYESIFPPAVPVSSGTPSNVSGLGGEPAIG
jgi:hypothetical protein